MTAFNYAKYSQRGYMNRSAVGQGLSIALPWNFRLNRFMNHIVSTNGTVPGLQVIMTFINTCMLLLTCRRPVFHIDVSTWIRTNILFAACTLAVPSIDVQHCPKVWCKTGPGGGTCTLIVWGQCKCRVNHGCVQGRRNYLALRYGSLTINYFK